MGLRALFDSYFDNDLSYEELKEKIKEDCSTEKECKKVIEIFDAVEEYYRHCNEELA